MLYHDEIEAPACTGIPVQNKKKLHQEIFCALCGTSRKIWVASSHLTPFQHLQTVLFSAFLAWIFFPLIGMASFFLYPFVWAMADLGKKALFRRAAQCKFCGFDAVTYKKDLRKAKEIIKNHVEHLPKNVTFKNAYRSKNSLENTSDIIS